MSRVIILELSTNFAKLHSAGEGISSLYCLQVCLMSRDEQNVLVVSYAELKNCLEQSYGEVLAAATAKPKHHLGLS